MKYVLAEIIRGKICGLYGGPNKKYYDIFNYCCSADFHTMGEKFDDIAVAVRVKNRLNRAGYSFEIIVINE